MWYLRQDMQRKYGIRLSNLIRATNLKGQVELTYLEHDFN